MSQFQQIAQNLYDFAHDHDESTEITPYFYQSLTNFLDQGLQNPELRGEKLDCETGCAACCHLPVKCPPEIIFFIRHCLASTLGDEQMTELKTLLQTYMDQWSQTSETERFLTRIPCPFLDPDNACLIYDIRPFSCRAFTSTDVRVCDHILVHPDDKETSVTQNSFIHALFQLATTILSSVAKSKGRDNGQVYFIPTLLIALENPQLEEDWKNGKKLPFNE